MLQWKRTGAVQWSMLNLVLLCVILVMSPLGDAHGALSGSGTYESPFLITSFEDLQSLSQSYNDQAPSQFTFYRLTADIDAEGRSIIPIGSDAHAFFGMVQGDGHVIRDLIIDTVADGNETPVSGLFGYTTLSVISDLHLENLTLQLDQPASAILCAGAFVGYSSQTRWKGCTSTGQSLTITKTDEEIMPVFGGFAGYADGSSFSGCTIDGTLNAEILPSGGLSDALGGFIGVLDGSTPSLTDCQARGTLSVRWTNDCDWFRIGGFIGVNRSGAAIEDCLSDMVMSLDAAVSKNLKIGGFVGVNEGDAEFTANQSRGDITLGIQQGFLLDDFAGGTLVGGFFGEVIAGHAVNCATYNTILIPGPGQFVGSLGGFAGGITNAAVTLEDCLYDGSALTVDIGVQVLLDENTFAAVGGFAGSISSGTLTGCQVGSIYHPEISGPGEGYTTDQYAYESFYSVGGFAGYVTDRALAPSALYTGNLFIDRCYVNDASVIGYTQVGGWAGKINTIGYRNTGSDLSAISNCEVLGTQVRGRAQMGGFAGHIVDAVITRNQVKGCNIQLIDADSWGEFLGGFCGWGQTSVFHECAVYDPFIQTEGQASNKLGGFIGFASQCDTGICQVNNAFIMPAENSTAIGGFAGASQRGDGGNGMYQCFATGGIFAQAGCAEMGGFIGTNEDSIWDSYSWCNVMARTRYENAGGFVGNNTEDGFIDGCYSMGLVAAKHSLPLIIETVEFAYHTLEVIEKPGIKTTLHEIKSFEEMIETYVEYFEDEAPQISMLNVGGFMGLGLRDGTGEAGEGLGYHNYWDKTTSTQGLAGGLGPKGLTTEELTSGDPDQLPALDTTIFDLSQGYPLFKWQLTGTDTYGTPDNPIRITSTQHLMYYLSDSLSWNKAMVLDQDVTLDFSDTEDPVPSFGSAETPFSGTFDGNGHTIDITYPELDTTTSNPLFNEIAGGTVKNVSVRLDYPQIAVDHDMGLLVNHLDGGVVDGCVTHMLSGFTMDINGNLDGYHVGGIIGTMSNHAVLSNSYSDVNFGLEHNYFIEDGYIGGLVGQAEDSEVIHSYFSGNIDLPPGNKGFIIGEAEASRVDNCAGYRIYFYYYGTNSFPAVAATDADTTVSVFTVEREERSATIFEDAGWQFRSDDIAADEGYWQFADTGVFPSLWFELVSAAGSNASLASTPLSALSYDEKAVPSHPFSADTGQIHEDSYNSGVTDLIAPLGDNSRTTVLESLGNPLAAGQDFFVAAYSDELSDGTGIALHNTQTGDILGTFLPGDRETGHDGSYQILPQSIIMNPQNQIIAATSDGHIIILDPTVSSDNGSVTWEKPMDLDVMGYAQAQTDRVLTRTIFALHYDWEGNLWFATGGSRMDPDDASTAQGIVGYVDPDQQIFFQLFDVAGENVENGFAVGSDGVFILTNQAVCRYVADPDGGVQQIWRSPYDTSGVKTDPDDNLAGGGLSYGSGTTPSLSGELVIFTDNVVPVHLIAVKRDTGEPVCQVPLFLDTVDIFRVAVDQSPVVYDQGDLVSVVITNTYGAYDPETGDFWESYITGGNSVLEPGILRVDLIRQDDGTYAPHYIWERTDYSTTTLVKFSTASGYLYAYSQNLAYPDAQEWQFDILHFETGETALSIPSGSGAAYNNTTGGMVFIEEQQAVGVPTDAGFLMLADTAGKADNGSDSGCFIATTAGDPLMPVNGFRLASRWIDAIVDWFSRP